jgi:hypothetical protein
MRRRLDGCDLNLGQINRVNQLTESAEIAAVRGQDQTRKVPDFRFVSFLRQRPALDDLASADKVRELPVQLGYRTGR